MLRGLDLGIVLEVMLSGMKFRGKKRNLGESKELGLPVCTAAVSHHVTLPGKLSRLVPDVVHDLAVHW